jgi:hypothetical protein
MVKKITSSRFSCLILLFLLTNLNSEKSSAQCFLDGTNNFVLDSIPNVSDFAIADFTGDSIPDLAVDSWDSSMNRIIVYKNEGRGNFSIDTSFYVPYSNDLITANLKGDGRTDLIVQRSDHPAYVYLNEGSGKFKLDTSHIVDYSFSRATIYSDVNNDSKDDALFFQSQSSFSVSLDLGNDSFAMPVRYLLPFNLNSKFNNGFGPFSYTVANIDDKYKDIIFCTEINDSGFIVIYKNNGSGIFTNSKNIYVPFKPLTVDVHDMNNDSLQDIIVADPNDSLHILLQDDSGSFHQSGVIDAAPNLHLYKLSVKDLNGDGKPDILSMLDDGDLEIFFGNGKGQIDSSKYYITRSGDFSGRFTLEPKDLNGDGKPDIAILNGDNRITFMWNDGKGNFGYPYLYDEDSASDYFSGYQNISVADVNDDGKPDIALSGNTENVRIITYSNNLNFKTDTVLFPNQYVTTAKFEDLNDDGLPDLVVEKRDKLISLINEGNFNFYVQDSIPFYDGDFAFGDFNGDGKTDIAVSNVDSNYISIYLNDGTGKFSKFGNNLSTGNYPEFIETGDFNMDGKTDFVVTNYFSGDAVLYKNDGNASFTSSRLPLTLFGPRCIAVADFNGDGYPDIAITSNYGDYKSIIVFINDKTGNFPNYTYYDAGQLPSSLHAADMNGDGKPDLIMIAGEYIGSMAGEILYNNGDGTFGNSKIFPTVESAGDIAGVDLNGDHKNDLIMTDVEGNVLDFFFNCDSGTIAAIPNNTEITNNLLSIFPNPTTGNFTILLKAQGLKELNSWLNIYNLYGQKVYQKKLIVNQKSIDQALTLGTLVNGIYFVNIYSGNETWQTKLIKQ